MKDYEKNYDRRWDSYKVSNIKWINLNREHLCRKKYIDFIEQEDIKDIVEVGGGEFIEAQAMLSNDVVDKYSIVDVSKVFLKLARSIDGINAFEGNMVDMPFNDKQFDLIYCSSVLEHSPDIHETIKEMSRVSHRFYFNMYKWKMKTGDLNSYFKKKKNYYTTAFNIDMILDLISRYGNIDDLVIYGGDEENPFEQSFEEYRKNNQDIDENRNRKYLAICGQWNK